MSDFTKEELERLLLEVDAGLTKAKQSHGKLMLENSELRRENAALRQQVAELATLRERLEAATYIIDFEYRRKRQTFMRNGALHHWSIRYAFESHCWHLWVYTKHTRPYQVDRQSPIDCYLQAAADGWLPPASTNHEPPKGQ